MICVLTAAVIRGCVHLIPHGARSFELWKDPPCVDDLAPGVRVEDNVAVTAEELAVGAGVDLDSPAALHAPDLEKTDETETDLKYPLLTINSFHFRPSIKQCLS